MIRGASCYISPSQARHTIAELAEPQAPLAALLGLSRVIPMVPLPVAASGPASAP